jgi:3-deoxy-D-manno-octulosonic-acid transferase
LRYLARLLYAAVARLAGLLAVVVPEADSKTALAIRARRGITKRYATWGTESRDSSRALVWVHAPSVGEGLQARPVLALLRERRPDVQLAYTFFSPSAEEFSRGLNVDFRDYLPFDIPGDVGAALDALRPRVLVFSKLDVWPTLVEQARRRGVRLGIISATLAAASGRRQPFARALLHDAYHAMDAVGAVDALDADRLVDLGVRRQVIEVTGDTRFDQVWQRATHVNRESRILAQFLTHAAPTIVAGSTWPSDEAHLIDAFAGARQRLGRARLIIAPHELHADHLEALERACHALQLRVARIDDVAAADRDVVVVDRFGILGDLYAVADVAFVGGGFHDAGLHSVLEPAAFGAPVLFGPRHTRSRDALLLLAAGGASTVTGTQELEQALTLWLGNETERRSAGARARAVVESNLGAAERSFRLVERLLGS